MGDRDDAAGDAAEGAEWCAAGYITGTIAPRRKEAVTMHSANRMRFFNRSRTVNAQVVKHPCNT